MKTKKVTLDKDKVYASANEIGLDVTTLSKELGYERNTLSSMFVPSRGGVMNISVANAIAYRLGKKVEELVKEVEEEPVVEETPAVESGDTLLKELQNLTSAINHFTEVYERLWGTK